MPRTCIHLESQIGSGTTGPTRYARVNNADVFLSRTSTTVLVRISRGQDGVLESGAPTRHSSSEYTKKSPAGKVGEISNVIDTHSFVVKRFPKKVKSRTGSIHCTALELDYSGVFGSLTDAMPGGAGLTYSGWQMAD